MNKTDTAFLFSKGYGISSKAIWQDQSISIYDKAIIHYFLSYTGAGNSVCFPSLARICGDLKISRPTACKSIQALVERGYISQQKKKVQGFLEKSYYTVRFFEPDQVTEAKNACKHDLHAHVNDIDMTCKHDLHAHVNELYINNTSINKTNNNTKIKQGAEAPIVKEFLNFLYEVNEKKVIGSRLYSKASKAEAEAALKAESFEILKAAYRWAKDQDFWKRIVVYPSHWSTILTQYKNQSKAAPKLIDPSAPRKFDEKGFEV